MSFTNLIHEFSPGGHHLSTVNVRKTRTKNVDRLHHFGGSREDVLPSMMTITHPISMRSCNCHDSQTKYTTLTMRIYVSTDSTKTTPLLRLRHATLPDILHAFLDDLFTTEQLVKIYLTRIQEVDYEFHAIIETNPNATEDARLLDLERRLRGARGPLHGIPILLKDNIPTLDNTDTTCGSLALVGAKPPKEADVVTALRKAGAVILGKGNMAEWSGFRSTSRCSGWSARGGETTGVFYPGMKASGSSSGCAVAVALGMCFAALGTEVYSQP